MLDLLVNDHQSNIVGTSRVTINALYSWSQNETDETGTQLTLNNLVHLMNFAFGMVNVILS